MIKRRYTRYFPLSTVGMRRVLFTPGPEEAQVRGKDELFCRKPALTCALALTVHSIHSKAHVSYKVLFCLGL